ncbi:hypothetical protein [Sporomusa sphaeroides]|uniref:Uncharacterized protein n=1 Tax=Sporomusa sphaeroides DSM 2875 TaxID=1337886 RepID=A0ABM9W6S6_9FIRM|nr:hypothetical protein [Sporomusa sphaeroides]OLS54625.1 hypothetical protein SPSPH_44170 [Sporomusa sphaeroides DSM 2875]CVK20844.1 hypothetical protein SSPH_03512 [Sporomusa sphaeroides DSM 2875]
MNDISVKNIDFNSENVLGKTIDEPAKLQTVQNSGENLYEHKIAEEDRAKTINKIVDIAKEILLITGRELPIDRK